MSAEQILCDLVQRASINPMGRTWTSEEYLFEHRVTAYLDQFLRNLSLAPYRQSIAPYRENLIVEWRPAQVTRKILLEVHQDTVPVEGMTIDPFAGAVRDGKLYGRGACDVKGSMTAILLLIQQLIAKNPLRGASLTIAFTIDEEHTFLGVQKLVEIAPEVDFAVVFEPTNLQIVETHKGLVRWSISTNGRACHSSRPRDGINAIYRMGHLIQCIERYANEELNGPRFPPDPRLGNATLNIGRIHGGQSANIVPDYCQIDLDRRLLPGENALQAMADLQNYLHAHLGDFGSMTPPQLICPPLIATEDNVATRELSRAIRSIGLTPQLHAVPFGTDASTIQEKGIPVVVFGPGDIAQAHTCDEWIELAQIDHAAAILYRLVVEE